MWKDTCWPMQHCRNTDDQRNPERCYIVGLDPYASEIAGIVAILRMRARFLATRRGRNLRSLLLADAHCGSHSSCCTKFDDSRGSPSYAVSPYPHGRHQGIPGCLPPRGTSVRPLWDYAQGLICRRVPCPVTDSLHPRCRHGVDPASDQLASMCCCSPSNPWLLTRPSLFEQRWSLWNFLHLSPLPYPVPFRSSGVARSAILTS